MLSQLKLHSLVVADTGDFNLIKNYSPIDCTTNPSLIYKASQMEQYSHLLDKAVKSAKEFDGTLNDKCDFAFDFLSVLFGKEILDIIPGRVSTEVDARLSFNCDGTVERAKRIISMYEILGIKKDRILIKISSTWEGIQAAKILENKFGIHCNLTLLFNLTQAVACADAGVTLISPFVGRILDWHLKNNPSITSYQVDDDPGVRSICQIYEYYKYFDYKTTVMGASFRNVQQILALSGIDSLTISPNLLEELGRLQGTLERKLEPSKCKSLCIQRINLNEEIFRWQMNNDPMANDKLSEGIRLFDKDAQILRKKIASFLNNP